MIKLIYINDTWLPVQNIDDVSTIIREYYNKELADQMDKLFLEHTNEEYDELRYELTHNGDVINIMQEEIFQLHYKIEKLEAQLSEANDKIFKLEI